jgi:epoxyqueuosine reductase
LKLGFDDIGFTTAEPFESQKEVLLDRQEEYKWILNGPFDLMEGIDPKKFYPNAKSIIVLVACYFKEGFPASMEGKFGRLYIDDDRITQIALILELKNFQDFLRENGIDSVIPPHLPHRIAAARAGLGTFGKNSLLYSNKLARGGSWILPIPLIVDQEFTPDEYTYEIGCPEWCKNACINSCPTGALKGPRKLDPRECISFLTYYGSGLTPRELREPMGMWVYGCDRCQNVCPRNSAWLAQDLQINKRAADKEENFRLRKLLHMDKRFYRKTIWPHMFYMSFADIWRWKMNAARVMGNSLDPQYIPDLTRAFEENTDERVKGMIAWALGRIGGAKAKAALETFLNESDGITREEISEALNEF